MLEAIGGFVGGFYMKDKVGRISLYVSALVYPSHIPLFFSLGEKVQKRMINLTILFFIPAVVYSFYLINVNYDSYVKEQQKMSK